MLEVYSFRFSLLEAHINNKNIYFCVYIPKNDTQTIVYSIKKFGFTGFTLTAYDAINNSQFYNILLYRIQSCFIIDEEEIIVAFFINTQENLAISYFDFDLRAKGQNQQICQLSNTFIGTGIFFKSIYLENNLAALIFFKNGKNGKSLELRILHITLQTNGEYGNDIIFENNIDKYNFTTNVTLSDFIKINNERLVFVSTLDLTTLYILFFDFYNDYSSVKIRIYNYQLNNYKVCDELSIFTYNDYLVFSSTVNVLYTETVYSIFMIFGYANETEITDNTIIIDISLYLADKENYDSNNNIITKISENIIIDNNIFGYIYANQIKLIKIPDEIIFYNGDESEPLTDGEILEFNHRIIQNKNIIKNNDYYSFEFQFIIQEPDYETFYNYAHELVNYTSDSGNFEPMKFYGKTNTVKFKLCNENCFSCKTLGASIDDQQCESCLEDYRYDYINESPLNCVPLEYFIDK